METKQVSLANSPNIFKIPLTAKTNIDFNRAKSFFSPDDAIRISVQDKIADQNYFPKRIVDLAVKGGWKNKQINEFTLVCLQHLSQALRNMEYAKDVDSLRGMPKLGKGTKLYSTSGHDALSVVYHTKVFINLISYDMIEKNTTDVYSPEDKKEISDIVRYLYIRLVKSNKLENLIQAGSNDVQWGKYDLHNATEILKGLKMRAKELGLDY